MFLFISIVRYRKTRLTNIQTATGTSTAWCYSPPIFGNLTFNYQISGVSASVTKNTVTCKIDSLIMVGPSSNSSTSSVPMPTLNSVMTGSMTGVSATATATTNSTGIATAALTPYQTGSAHSFQTGAAISYVRNRWIAAMLPLLAILR